MRRRSINLAILMTQRVNMLKDWIDAKLYWFESICGPLGGSTSQRKGVTDGSDA
jgi:hypothetical protein